nr:MAG TPA: hypothetical protein [Caudoviricetes sp.]
MLGAVRQFLRSNGTINEIMGMSKSAVSDMTRQMKETAKVAGQVYDYRTKMNRPAVFRRAMGYGNDVNLYNVPHQMTNTARLKSAFMDDTGKYSKARMIGAAGGVYMGTMSAGRILSGGGLYRDSNGNFDIMGVPFI